MKPPKIENKLSTLKKGTTFRFKGKRKVYTFDGGGPKKGFHYTPVEDCLSGDFQTKKDREVETDFTY